MGFSSPSNTIVVEVGDGSANSPIASYVDELRNLYINSSNLLAWIQSVDPAGTTSGRVKLHWDPNDLPPLSGVGGGPVVLISWDNLQTIDAGSAHAFKARVDLVVSTQFFAASRRVANQLITEINFLDKIVNEMVDDIGIELSATFGGHLLGIQMIDALQQSPGNKNRWFSESRYTIGFTYSR